MNSDDSKNSWRHFNPHMENQFKYYLIIFFVYCIIVLSIFVIYSKVYKSHKSRDQETAVFQIIDHFHEINIKLTIAFWCFVSFEFLLYYFEYLTLFYLFLLGSTVPFVCVSEVNQFLLGLLAIQRFFIYFYPSAEKYLNFSKRALKWILVVSYAVSVSEALLRLKTKAEKEPDVSLASIEDIYLFLRFIYNLSLQVFLTASAALYIPIVVSIGKLANLASAKISNPQRFVAWQLVVVVAKQMICLIYFFYGESEYEDKPYLRISAAIIDSKGFDALLMPTITQITYLGCNRRNVMALWKTVKPKWLFRSSRRINSDVRVRYGERIETAV